MGQICLVLQLCVKASNKNTMAPIPLDAGVEIAAEAAPPTYQIDPMGVIPLLQLLLMPFIPALELLAEYLYSRYAVKRTDSSGMGVCPRGKFVTLTNEAVAGRVSTGQTRGHSSKYEPYKYMYTQELGPHIPPPPRRTASALRTTPKPPATVKLAKIQAPGETACPKRQESWQSDSTLYRWSGSEPCHEAIG